MQLYAGKKYRLRNGMEFTLQEDPKEISFFIDFDRNYRWYYGKEGKEGDQLVFCKDGPPHGMDIIQEVT